MAVSFLHALYHLPIVFIVRRAYLAEGNRWLTVRIFLPVLTTARTVYGWMGRGGGLDGPA